MPLLHVNQRTPEWLACRQGKITASLAAGCLGWDPYTSRQKAWRSVLGIGETVENRHMRWGVQFEAAARLDYEAETGNLVEETGFWVHPALDWLGASPDGLIGADGLCEIKCPTVPPDRVPLHHRVQMLVQLAVTGRSWCDYFSWGASGQRFLARVRPAGTDGLLTRLEQFYRAFVLTGIEPPRKQRKKRRAS